MSRKTIRILFFVFISVTLFAQGVRFSRETRSFILHKSPVIALKNVRIIKGDGSPAVPGQTVILKGGKIAAMGDVDTTQIPEDAETIDLTGKSLLPGFIMFHEHLWYPAGRQYNAQVISFTRLYLASGVTTMRTAGSIEPYTDLNLRDAIKAGRLPGPKIRVTSPFFNGPGMDSFYQLKALKGPDDARRMVAYWDAEGVDDFKVYALISREDMKAVIDEVHKRGKKVTGHIGAVTYREAADLGIDCLEHGFFMATDFVKNKVPDKNPPASIARKSLAELDPDGPEATDLIQHLIDKGVAIDSTLVVLETFLPGRPPVPDAALDAMATETRDLYLRTWARIATAQDSVWPGLFKNGMALEKRFFDAGGLLLVGTDPTGYGGIVAGYANFRAIELLVEAGLSPLEAIQVATANGAKYLEIEDILGTVEVGKIADLVVCDGDPSNKIKDIYKVEIVFKDGIGYDSKKLFDSIKGMVGLR
jgi:imidazolonepropionase-like amidohydrolase